MVPVFEKDQWVVMIAKTGMNTKTEDIKPSRFEFTIGKSPLDFLGKEPPYLGFIATSPHGIEVAEKEKLLVESIKVFQYELDKLRGLSKCEE